MQPAAPGLRGAVRHEEEMLDRDAAADAAIATLAAMFPHVPAPVLQRTLAIGGSADHAATLLLENDWRSFEPRDPRFTAARSVHLDFHFGGGGGAQAFYNECVVPRATTGDACAGERAARAPGGSDHRVHDGRSGFPSEISICAI